MREHKNLRRVTYAMNAPFESQAFGTVLDEHPQADGRVLQRVLIDRITQPVYLDRDLGEVMSYEASVTMEQDEPEGPTEAAIWTVQSVLDWASGGWGEGAPIHVTVRCKDDGMTYGVAVFRDGDQWSAELDGVPTKNGKHIDGFAERIAAFTTDPEEN